jgi:alkanesulfonate monooxygenase SsuD/methylene tetrahydromethanopterin reductase-like flavin-dependent oxidoreductase (luciferase family)
MKVIRFNQVQPGLEPVEMSARYRASLDMAAYADGHGFDIVSLEEHHGAPDGWSPSPLITAGMVFGRCPRIGVSISALLVPLHDPLRIAEDIAVLDLASGGRLTVIAGLGYRPEEYAAHGKSWADRGKLMDEALDAMVAGWTGEPFEYRGTTVQVTPRPLTQPHPLVLVGGTSKPAARRAARLGLPLSPAAHLPELEAYYYAQCAEHGTSGFCAMPAADLSLLFVHEDPDKAWAELGKYFLHEARTYAAWQTPDIHSAVHSHATTAEELRAEGIYKVLTPEECVAQGKAQGAGAIFTLHPLVGGMPIDEAWKCLDLFGEQVVPNL